MAMTIASEPTIETFSGIAKEHGGGWWALCDQLPIATYGSSYTGALKGMIGSISTFRAYSNGCGIPALTRLPREERMREFELRLELSPH